jgi:hypothetical protein
VTVAQGPARRRLILVAVGLGCVAIVVIALWILAGYAAESGSTTTADQQTRATVRASASCQGTDNNDTVSFVLSGQTHQAKLNGCGHEVGEVLAVLVPARFDSNTVLAQADAAPGDSSGLSHRVAFLLLVLATAVGGVCGYQIFRIRNQGGGSIRTVGPRRTATTTGTRQPVVPRPSPGSRLAARFRSSSADRDEVYPGESRKPSANDPEATGVDWFEDSSATMHPVDPPPGVGR